MATPHLTLRYALREAARQAFSQVRLEHPKERFYYFALVTNGCAGRPVPCACSVEAMINTLTEYRQMGYRYDAADLRWSAADSPYFLHGDEHFQGIDELIDDSWTAKPPARAIAERFCAMEDALLDLCSEGFFGRGAERWKVLINVVAPGSERDEVMFQRARHLNPPESLTLLKQDLWG